MQKIFFIFGVFVFQSCFASDDEPLFGSSDDSIFMEPKDKNRDEGKDDNAVNFVTPTYQERINEGHYILSGDNDVIFYFFNTGQGNCTLVKQGKKALLIDCGGSSITAFDGTFTQCLENAIIECVIITHPHDDHYGFLQTIPKECFSENVFLLIGGPSEWEEYKDGKKINKNLNAVVNSFKIEFKKKYYFTVQGGARNIDNINTASIWPDFLLKNLFDGVEFKFLGFGEKLLGENNLNSYSLVFKITYKNNSILFTGDSTGDAFDRFLTKSGTNSFQNSIVVENRKIIKNVNVFVMPHHGTDTDCSWRWTNRIIKDNYSDLVAMIACVDPATSPYGHARNWIRDLIFPPYARMLNENRLVGYNIKAKKGRGADIYDCFIKKTKNRLYETGLFTYGIVLVFSESGNIHILNSPNDTNLTQLSKNGEEKDDIGSKPQYPIISVGQNYQIFDVPSDGNCGVWAILVATGGITLEDLDKLMVAYKDFKVKKGLNYNPSWNDCCEVLNDAVPSAVQKMINLRTNSNIGILGNWLGNDDLPTIANIIQRPIVLVQRINRESVYTLYDSNNAGENLMGQTIEQILKNHNNAIFIYYENYHYQAMIPQNN